MSTASQPRLKRVAVKQPDCGSVRHHARLGDGLRHRDDLGMLTSNTRPAGLDTPFERSTLSPKCSRAKRNPRGRIAGRAGRGITDSKQIGGNGDNLLS
jgi:hypothetical protein